MKEKLKFEFKKKSEGKWEELVTKLINSDLNVCLWSKDEHLAIHIDCEYSSELVIKKDGTWSLE